MRTAMRTAEFETSAFVDSDCATHDCDLQLLQSAEDDDLSDEQFFTMLESLLAHGTGALVVVR